jgi:hypothetical protein
MGKVKGKAKGKQGKDTLDWSPKFDSLGVRCQGERAKYVLDPTKPPSQAELEECTRHFKESIRKSWRFKVMILLYGKDVMDKLLEETKLEVR